MNEQDAIELVAQVKRVADALERLADAAVETVNGSVESVLDQMAKVTFEKDMEETAKLFGPCPFCGSRVEIYSAEDVDDLREYDDEVLAGTFHFCCSGDNCLLGGEDNFVLTNWENAEEAAAAWNRRVVAG